ncbi:MAG: carbohydrate-binding family V/XII [Candidatus Eisenbacteria bacterium]|uniref:Carbohydrate-binding family V/XII n=1 Tax=Eiseniibacteriota bacterium TaxID=2212470 RepID=A0A538UE69_UNCEI|nr:MAG: carbohydrate-binding family V/XII [Candidatus Eisenbacteria bacterium]
MAALALGLLVGLAAAAHADPADWPRAFDTASGAFIIYEPQPEALDGDVLSGRAAFSLQRSGSAEPSFGVLWFTEHIQIDRDSSTVAARAFDVTKVRLPGITPAEAERYETQVESEAARWDLTESLEQLQAGLASAEKERASVADLDHTPPRIIFSPRRAILVLYDGAPVVEPIPGSRLERVANTPYAVVHDPTRRAYFLSGADLWYQAKDPLGPWHVILGPPDEVRAVVPPDTSAADRTVGPPPQVLTATEPTELIATDGPPVYAPLVDDELLYVTNTESDVVREVSTQAIYVLLAGRWYRATTLDGPWTFVRGDQLPPSFARVPPGSPKANILASVAGTDQADDAVADAEIPQTSAIRREATGFQVDYDGPPQFEPIAGTRMEYAVNTDAEVILADGRYYACEQGVWYVADDPNGPWRVSEVRPVRVDDIPPSCPVYDVRYVYIYDVTPDVVWDGYLPGYLGCYPYHGTIVYGTGYRYRPWRGRHHYYPRPCTWGMMPRYNPWLSRWSFGFSFGSGFLKVGSLWHPGALPRGPHGPPRWFGPGGFHRPLLAADRSMLRNRRPNPLPARPLGERTPMNLYRRPANLPVMARAVERLTRPPVARPAPAPVPNDVFAGKDGKVYRREPRGWKVNQGRSWVPASLPVTPPEIPVRGTPDPGTVRSWPPGPRPVRPQPTPSAPAREPHRGPAFRPPPPTISPAPGDLEREYRGRTRANGHVPETPVRFPIPGGGKDPKRGGS